MTDKEQLEAIKLMSTPVGYASMRLGKKLHPVHKDVITALFSGQKTKVSFRAANSVGKTTSVAAISILYAIEVLNANVVSTARVHKQVTKQLVPALKSYSHLFPKWQFNDTTIKVDGIDKYVGFTTNEDSRFQGYHKREDQPLLIIIDEAAGISEDIYKAAMTRCLPDYLLVMGSPLGPEGVFYSIETEPSLYKLFKHFKLSQPECLTKNGYWIDESTIQETIQQWSHSPEFVQSTVYAEFSVNTTDGIITLFDVNSCIEAMQIRSSGQRHVAIDFAAGGAETVISYRNGNQVDIIKAWKERETMQAAREIVDELNKLKESDGLRPSEVSGDADGMGLPIIHRIKELGWAINEWHGGSKAKDENYKNAITEAWFEGCKKIKNRSIIMPDDKELKQQIISRKHRLHSSGKPELESKADMASRGVKSPDRADAFFMSLTEPSHGLLTFAHVPLPPAKVYKGLF